MFRLIRIRHGRINQGEPMKLPVTANESYVFGEALVLTNGKVTMAGSTNKPAYIAGENLMASQNATHVLVYPIDPAMEFECPVSAAPANLKVGDKVTLTTDAMGVTATTTSGVATILDKGTAQKAGDILTVQFV